MITQKKLLKTLFEKRSVWNRYNNILSKKSRADLTGADLTGADLTRANLDFTGFELSCKTLNIKCDERLVAQLAYHLCRLNYDGKDFIEVKKALMSFANKFHRVQECGEIK